jgi:hypothetical protein
MTSIWCCSIWRCRIPATRHARRDIVELSDVPVIVITGMADEALALRAAVRGAGLLIKGDVDRAGSSSRCATRSSVPPAGAAAQPLAHRRAHDLYNRRIHDLRRQLKLVQRRAGARPCCWTWTVSRRSTIGVRPRRRRPRPRADWRRAAGVVPRRGRPAVSAATVRRHRVGCRGR